MLTALLAAPEHAATRSAAIFNTDTPLLRLRRVPLPLCCRPAQVPPALRWAIHTKPALVGRHTRGVTRFWWDMATAVFAVWCFDIQQCSYLVPLGRYLVSNMSYQISS